MSYVYFILQITDHNDNAESRCWAVEYNGSSKCITIGILLISYIYLLDQFSLIILELLYNIKTSL